MTEKKQKVKRNRDESSTKKVIICGIHSLLEETTVFCCRLTNRLGETYAQTNFYLEP